MSERAQRTSLAPPSTRTATIPRTAATRHSIRRVHVKPMCTAFVLITALAACSNMRCMRVSGTWPVCAAVHVAYIRALGPAHSVEPSVLTRVTEYLFLETLSSSQPVCSVLAVQRVRVHDDRAAAAHLTNNV